MSSLMPTLSRRSPVGTRVRTTLGVAIAFIAGVAGVVPPLRAQANLYSDGLLERLRGLAYAVPGSLPMSVRFLSVQDDSGLLSNLVDGAAKTKILEMDPVFQVRYSSGWIMVYAGIATPAAAGKEGTFYQDPYYRVQSAIAHAGLIVLTHEHIDHIGGLLDPTVPAAVAARTMLNRGRRCIRSHPTNRPAVCPASLQQRLNDI